MKTVPLLFCLIAASITPLITSAGSTDEVVELGLDFKVMRTVRTVTNQTGQVLSQPSRYTILGNGLNRRDADGNWVECKPAVLNYPAGIVCTGAVYRVILNTNLNRQGSVDLEFNNGQRLVSHPLAIGLFDPESGRRVWLARINDCQAEVFSNKVVYASAFTNGALQASIVYNYEAGLFHQDVLFTATPNVTPAALGMGERTRLEVASEFMLAPSITRTNRVLRRERDLAQRSRMVEPDLVDETLIFSEQARMPMGFAFSNDSSPTNRSPRVPVAKRLRTMVDGRTVLVESVEWREIAAELARLPRFAAGGSGDFSNGFYAENLPPRPPGHVEGGAFAARLSSVSRSGAVELAKAEALDLRGVVLDYVVLSGGGTMTLTPGTYLVNSDAYFDWLYCDPGVEIQFGYYYRLYLGGITANSDYASAPAIITSQSGSPMGGLTIDNLHDSIFAYGATLSQLDTAIEWTANSSWPGELNQCEFSDCNVAIYAWEHDYPLTIAQSSFQSCGPDNTMAAIRQSGAGHIAVSDSQFSSCGFIYSGSSPDSSSTNTFSLDVAPMAAMTGDSLYADMYPGDGYGSIGASLYVGWNSVFPAYPYYYTVSGSYPERWEVPAATLGLDGQAIATFDLRYTQGSVAWAGVQGSVLDGDGDGMLDSWEQQYFGDLAQAATDDYDSDGASNLAEYSAGTNPTSFDNLQLGHWRFDPPVYQRGDQGQMPLAMVGTANVPGVSTNAVSMTSASTTILKYRIGEANGNTNIFPSQGTICFWYSPAWSSGSGPGVEGRLLEMGMKNTALGWWGLLVDSTGNNLYLATHGSNPATLKTHVSAAISWAADAWHQIVLTYSASETTLYVDGQAVATGGLGVDAIYSDPTFYSLGFRLGSDNNGGNRAKGTFDELAVFNHQVDAAAVALATDADNDFLPDGWEWQHFGDFSQVGGDDYDGDGKTNAEEYNLGTNPNTIAFLLSFESMYSTSASPSGSVEVRGGHPTQIVKVVDTDPHSLSAAQVNALSWENCPAGTESGSVLSVDPSLGSTEGWHTVWVGMRGANWVETPTWNSCRIKLDTTPPVNCLVNPGSGLKMTEALWAGSRSIYARTTGGRLSPLVIYFRGSPATTSTNCAT